MFKISFLFVAILLVQSQTHRISTRSVSSEVDTVIKRLSSTIAANTHTALELINRDIIDLERHISYLKTKSNNEFTSAIKEINRTESVYQDKARLVRLQISNCSIKLSEEAESLAKIKITLNSCANNISNSFGSTKNATIAAIEALFEDVVDLQTKTVTCLEDELCLLNVKVEALKYQSHWPLAIQLYSDQLREEHKLAGTQLDKCIHDNSINNKKSEVLSKLAKCVNDIIINTVKPSESTSSTSASLTSAKPST